MASCPTSGFRIRAARGGIDLRQLPRAQGTHVRPRRLDVAQTLCPGPANARRRPPGWRFVIQRPDRELLLLVDDHGILTSLVILAVVTMLHVVLQALTTGRCRVGAGMAPGPKNYPDPAPGSWSRRGPRHTSFDRREKFFHFGLGAHR